MLQFSRLDLHLSLLHISTETVKEPPIAAMPHLTACIQLLRLEYDQTRGGERLGVVVQNNLRDSFQYHIIRFRPYLLLRAGPAIKQVVIRSALL